jgi:superfamily II DNA or RNA helicase
LKKRSWPNDKLSASARERFAVETRKRWQKYRAAALAPQDGPPRVPQPPRSPLCDKLVENLGRQFQADEASFVRQLQTSFANARVRKLMETDLRLMAGRGNTYDSWKQLDLWPDFPPNDFYFWLYVAWELRRRNWEYPQFIAGITDFHLIEPAIKQWERDKAIEQWTNWFREFDRRAPVSESGGLELRLAVGAEEARLQWRTHANSGFAELKQAQARRIAEQFENGAQAIAPDSLPLWSAVYRPWGYESWWLFRYASGTARPGLNRLLRMPLAPDRVVTDDGRPLARVAEPLCLNLRSPENGNGSYQLALVTSDGSPPPKILCTLAGQPTLYLTKRGLFAGPLVDALDTELPKNIPAPALETADGLRFLHAAGIALPEHLSQRIRIVPVRVTISCALRSVYPGSQFEDIVLRVAAKAPGMKSERFAPTGWEAERENKAGGNSELADDIVAVHDRAAQKYFPRALESLELKWQNNSGEWILRLIKKTPELFVAWLQSLPPEIEVLLDDELATLRDAPVSGFVSLDVAEAGIDWFDLKVALKVSDTTLTPQELKLLLNARGGYARLGKRGWRRLQFSLTPEDEEQLARLGLDARDFSAEPQRFHALQLADDAAKKFLAPERVEEIQRRASELKTRVAPPLPPAIRAEMRPYQTEGFHFLAYLASNRFGGVLADDMGLGKTLQTLAWLAWLRETALQAQPATLNSSLVVCPKSVMDNWHAEAERFYPNLRVRLWRGEPATELSAARENSDLLVINYAQLRSLSPGIASAQWLAAILDEAQYIKNPSSQTAQAARALKAEHRLALTGTPIENRLLDLWSILSFAMAGALGNRAHFLRCFDAKDDPLARRRLAARVRPFLLRRTKAQVEKDLPDRVEKDLLCEMEGEQKTLYLAELKRARQLILGLQTNEQLNEERFNILTSLLRLRQICCHPALVDARLRAAESAKVSALEDLLGPLIEEGHKVLVFSQFATMLDLLREKLKQRGWPHFYLAGETENRGELVREFQSAKDSAVFLISLKAGGFGLNLTAASYVVLFDPWWNPAVENQAIDRTHRIGQTSKVMAYRLLMRESIEQKIRALQKQKAALAADVLGEERFAQSLTLEDLRFLFAEGTGDFMSATAGVNRASVFSCSPSAILSRSRDAAEALD